MTLRRVLRIINTRAWAVGYERKGGALYVRRVVWGRLAARTERREDEVIWPVEIRPVNPSTRAEVEKIRK